MRRLTSREALQVILGRALCMCHFTTFFATSPTSSAHYGCSLNHLLLQRLALLYFILFLKSKPSRAIVQPPRGGIFQNRFNYFRFCETRLFYTLELLWIICFDYLTQKSTGFAWNLPLVLSAQKNNCTCPYFFYLTMKDGLVFFGFIHSMRKEIQRWRQ